MDLAAIKRRYPNGLVFGIINGHGGIVDNKYTTAPNKMHLFPDGKIIYEGVENRHIVEEIIKQADGQFTCLNLVPENEDISLKERVRRANHYFDKYKSEKKLLIVIECHLNAFNTRAEGTEIFTTRTENLSDYIAELWWNNFINTFPNQKRRADYSDGDPDKEVDFYVIKNIKTFGILIEFFFFDNREEVDMYCNPEGYAKWAGTVIDTMKDLTNNIYN